MCTVFAFCENPTLSIENETRNVPWTVPLISKENPEEQSRRSSQGDSRFQGLEMRPNRSFRGSLMNGRSLVSGEGFLCNT